MCLNFPVAKFNNTRRIRLCARRHGSEDPSENVPGFPREADGSWWCPPPLSEEGYSSLSPCASYFSSLPWVPPHHVALRMLLPPPRTPFQPLFIWFPPPCLHISELVTSAGRLPHFPDHSAWSLRPLHWPKWHLRAGPPASPAPGTLNAWMTGGVCTVTGRATALGALELEDAGAYLGIPLHCD